LLNVAVIVALASRSTQQALRSSADLASEEDEEDTRSASWGATLATAGVVVLALGLGRLTMYQAAASEAARERATSEYRNSLREYLAAVNAFGRQARGDLQHLRWGHAADPSATIAALRESATGLVAPAVPPDIEFVGDAEQDLDSIAGAIARLTDALTRAEGIGATADRRAYLRELRHAEKELDSTFGPRERLRRLSGTAP
jgi:hypothetical protein